MLGRVQKVRRACTFVLLGKVRTELQNFICNPFNVTQKTEEFILTIVSNVHYFLSAINWREDRRLLLSLFQNEKVP